MPCQCGTDRKRAKCPWYIGPEAGIVETNDTTGEQRLATGCFPVVMIRWMGWVAKQSRSAAVATEQARNKMDETFDRVVGVITQSPPPGDCLLPNPLPLDNHGSHG